MEKLFISFSKYFLLDGTKEELEELKKEAGKNSGKYQKKASRYAKKLKKENQKLGFDVDFESFCTMLQNYVNIKDNMEEKDKKEYLEILTKLSLIHDVDLREELEKYISYKTKEPSDQESKEIFYKFCRYYLNKNNTVEDYNQLKDITKQYNIDFQEFQENAMSYVENIKNNAEELGLFTEQELFEESIHKYITNKQEMDDQRKSEYLRVIASLADIYGINLREILTKTTMTKEPKNDLENLLSSLTNPLDNHELLKELLLERYQNGSFEIRTLKIGADEPRETSEFDYPKEQAKLMIHIIDTYLEKISKGETENLNEEITSSLTDNMIEELHNLREEDIYAYLTEDDYPIDDQILDFINYTITTCDYRTEHIGTNELSLFKTESQEDNYTIYLNGPERETVYVLDEYIRRCIKENINYNMIGLWSGGDSKERSLLYTSEQDLIKKLSILDSIQENHPQWIESFGNPIYSSATRESYYGISLNSINDITYNDFFNSACEVAYYRVIAKIVINKIEKETEKEIIDNFIELINYTEDHIKLPEYASFNSVSFKDIKDLINTYIPDIITSLNLYFESDKLELLIEEFKKSLQYIFNIANNIDKKQKTNIACNFML